VRGDVSVGRASAVRHAKQRLQLPCQLVVGRGRWGLRQARAHSLHQGVELSQIGKGAGQELGVRQLCEPEAALVELLARNALRQGEEEREFRVEIEPPAEDDALLQDPLRAPQHRRREQDDSG
jgi:hypothetical protein